MALANGEVESNSEGLEEAVTDALEEREQQDAR